MYSFEPLTFDVSKHSKFLCSFWVGLISIAHSRNYEEKKWKRKTLLKYGLYLICVLDAFLALDPGKEKID